MKENNLLSPHRGLSSQDPHDGKITTDAPNVMWCSDGTKIFTRDDGWVWVFSVEEHWNAECLGWHVCKVGDRFAALEPVSQGVKRVYGSMGKGIAAGLKLRIRPRLPVHIGLFSEANSPHGHREQLRSGTAASNERGCRTI